MANSNPIKLVMDDEFINYALLQNHLNKSITMSIVVHLTEEGWKYDSDHVIGIQGIPDDLYNDNPEPENLHIGTAAEIVSKKFTSNSHFRLIRDGAGSETPPGIRFTLSFFADGELVDEFEAESNGSNPADFIANIKFVQS